MTFSINGLVTEEHTLTYDEFTALPMVTVQSDIHCVTGWSKLNNMWEGISTSAMKSIVTVLGTARYVIIKCSGNFTTNLTLDDFFAEDVLFALFHDGKSLTRDHGYPVRLIVPRLYLWKSAKWVQGIEFTDKDRPGFWESNGYHNHGDPWTEERYSY